MKKYPKILNILEQKKSDKTSYEVYPKYDGENISYQFERKNPEDNLWKGYWCSRNNIIDEDTIQGSFKKTQPLRHKEQMGLREVQEAIAKIMPNATKIVFYGEQYGKGIINRINYGNPKIIWFDIAIDDVFHPIDNFRNLFENSSQDLDLIKLYSNETIESFLINIAPYKEDPITNEGYVLKEPGFTEVGKRKMFKWLRPEFNELKFFQETKGVETHKELLAELPRLLIEPRLYNVKSKYGDTLTALDISKFKGLYFKDLFDDAKDLWPDIDPKVRKATFKRFRLDYWDNDLFNVSKIEKILSGEK